MYQVLRGALKADDLRAPYRANLFAQMSRPLIGNVQNEPNRRADFWTRFESSYLNRQHLCLYCHNTNFSVTGSASDWERHFPLPQKVELAAFDCDDGACQEPPDLQADFRYAGVVNAGSDRPWQLSASCGVFGRPTAEQPCSTVPDDIEDVCFQPGLGGAVRQPEPRFSNRGGVASVFRLDQMLSAGAASLAAGNLGPSPTPVRPVDPKTLGARAITAGERAFALMVAANVVERVWEEVHGTRLTVPNHFPRSSEQREELYRLMRRFMRPSKGGTWSLQEILKLILTSPRFNAASRAGTELYPLDVVFNPWILFDPRPDQAAIPAGERCTAAFPSYEGCIKSVLRANHCTDCHENPDRGREFGAPLWNHDFPGATSQRVTEAVCTSLTAAGGGCAAALGTDPVTGVTHTCAEIGGKPGSKIAVLVSCTSPGLRMPLGRAPVTDAQRFSLLRWVASNPTAPGTEVDVPSPGTFATDNSVGDQVHWKSPYQLTNNMGRALDLAPWPKPIPDSPTAYPSVKIADVAGHYLEDSNPGGRGLSFLGLMQWEFNHRDASKLPCHVGPGADRIDTLVAAAASSSQAVSVETVIKSLKQAFFGESAIDSDEAPLLRDVVGVSLSTRVTSGNSATVKSGLRSVCNVFMKSPLFLLSYVEPPAGVSATGAAELVVVDTANTATTSDATSFLPALCAGRLDCRPDAPLLEEILVDCFRNEKKCADGAGQKVTAEVVTVLGDLRIPAGRPDLDLQRARQEEPALVPSEFDARSASSLMVLPFGGGKITALKGQVRSLYRGVWSNKKANTSIAFGEVLFIPTGAQLTVEAAQQKFQTGSRGMEAPPPLATDTEVVTATTTTAKSAWIVVANGPAAENAPPASLDTTIPVGQAHTGNPEPPAMTEVGPVWSIQGEGGLWYRKPRPGGVDLRRVK
jgi:hypothetical protein